MTANELCGLHVSRETMDGLQGYAALLEKWNAKINLVAASTLPDFWDRHIVDSAQLFIHAPENAVSWVDLGSGGGLPGLVCAILSQEFSPERVFTLIESDARKAAFLTTAIREFGLNARVLTSRVEATEPQAADVVSARALASLPQLLPLVARHLAKGGVALLPKGRNYNEELAAVRLEWQFDIAIIDSQTDPLAKLLILKDLKRV
ncbi:16S rRNA (guanine(527)-N(7))-methyltransferase RsmG [Roseinatronobacter bogoriensis]|uniref:Ribosomal RNA small subunit methyltransferase G n=1 Tax=Roseinatronobacter bogoriensis subsp. barguzinensis TaxID=441209 RepID=A0A2K8K5H0_9RHOB|nr:MULTISPECIES: 16S rRNA (guanine(527)-N(7))-methyltransferase RsmG [Rhodobaca]ATX64701.1 16S rRNA (guanine(527)-N(7))-methyltransferase RsmG [Rhodobaca barguzinensis]MBB4209454.1 16S rRNA (guanine527-N7)-methyltransferase [Rhodobaca bogoriensis DSM 18756]TDW35180.1 16S rRNA (guanine527-N7)-methyltransferase [Rhodobaca barguzinensis]TDY66810.1 16S rRNA m(7)G-527 methyltransferase [Rhodobaca bogoriensis DSM 18756]